MEERIESNKLDASVVTKPSTDGKGRLGVIIGRFQTPDLHSEHKHIFKEVEKHCDSLIVLLGSTQAMNTIEDPMPYEVRKMMLSQYMAFNCFVPWAIHELPNRHDNPTWSSDVDKSLVGFDSESIITLYGGRDSFIPHYEGKYPTVKIEPVDESVSATYIRSMVQPECSRSFRAGMVHAANVRYPAVFPTVDIAILNRTGYKVLLGRKPGETAWRFPGGFVDPTDTSLSVAAKREAKEETSVELDGVSYVDSMLINDYRYKGRDKIMTSFFKGYISKESPQPVAGDDLEEVRWFNLGTPIDVMPAHRDLLDRLLVEEGL